ncbi:MAG: hypothetical protein QXD23_00415 [Candidatus Micrarchaeaceae archaeon]
MNRDYFKINPYKVHELHGSVEDCIKMAKTQKRIEKELLTLKHELATLSNKGNTTPSETDVNALLTYILQEREKTNKLLYSLTEKIKKLEEDIEDNYEVEDVPYTSPITATKPASLLNREIALSTLDVKILNFVQSKGMICAEDLKTEMKYKGRNAACARLNKLFKQGLLDRFQLGHKVYYKFDAGKATNTLIISPPR